MLTLLLFAVPLDFSSLERPPGCTAQPARATLTGTAWTFLRAGKAPADCELSFSFIIQKPAKQFGFFGSSWSVWPDGRFADQGHELGVELRGGYRVMLSHKYQALALVRWPDGGYVRVVSCPLSLKKPHSFKASVRANVVTVALDGKQLLRYIDPLPTLPGGGLAVGTSSGATVEVRDADLAPLPVAAREAAPPHRPNFSARNWLGGRRWAFDGDEPIMLLPAPESSSINNVKLRPGRKPMLSWNSHWDIQNQGAFPEGANTVGPVSTRGGGKELTASWEAKQTKGRFITSTQLTFGWDARRQTYTYSVASDLEVRPGPPFHFRYGYDFEHHTPLDPFGWQYLVMRLKDGKLHHRPVYPIDPGPQMGLATKHGLRMWYGRHGEKMEIAPAVEYDIDEKRPLNTAVCAAFYDTGASFPPETARPGTRVKVRYRYTGLPGPEARELFLESTIYPSPMLDPKHHYIFAEGWPRLGFHKYARMSDTWIYGRRPFMTGHNARPAYELVKMPEGPAMKLGPASFAAAALATPKKLAPGRYAVLARCRADNLLGPGARIELTVTVPKTGKRLAHHAHHVGTGSFGWRTLGFAFDVPVEGAGLTLGLGNAGTGELLVREVSFRKLEGPLPPGIAAKPAPPASVAPSIKGALADYRMEEGRGLHVFNHAGGALPHLELSSVGWTKDAGRPALVFEQKEGRKPHFPRWGALERSYLSHPSYKGRDTLPVAISGHHGGSLPVEAFTLAAWIKPAAAMGKGGHNASGDVIGFGARRIVLRLIGNKAPYRLGCSLNVNDHFESKTTIPADEWHHVAVTGEPKAGAWRVRLYLDGKEVAAGVTKVTKGPLNPPPSLVLGAELFYFHDSYYRGLIGRVLVIGRALGPKEVAALR